MCSSSLALYQHTQIPLNTTQISQLSILSHFVITKHQIPVNLTIDKRSKRESSRLDWLRYPTLPLEGELAVSFDYTSDNAQKMTNLNGSKPPWNYNSFTNRAASLINQKIIMSGGDIRLSLRVWQHIINNTQSCQCFPSGDKAHYLTNKLSLW